MAEPAIRVFYSYSRQDRLLREKLDRHLAPLKFAGLILPWYDLLLDPGSDWKQDIKDKLDTADIILLLISANFFNSEYCYSIELKRALERDARKEACVIPVILEPCDWRHEWIPFSKLTALPNDEKAITEWDNQEAAFTSVVQSIRLKVEKLLEERRKKGQVNHLSSQNTAGQKTEQELLIQQGLETSIQDKNKSISEKLIDLSQVNQQDLRECDPSKILFIKNVKDPEGWAYSLDRMEKPESRTFELMWLAGSHGVDQPKAEDLMILHQQAKVTHIVEFLDNQVRTTDAGSFRWVRAVWIAEQDWNQLPHQKDVLGFNPRYADGNTHSFNSFNFSTFREAWSSLEGFQQHVVQRLTQPEAIFNDADDLTSEKGVDYTRLRDLLQAGQWKEADGETAERMFEVMGRQEQGRLSIEDIQAFPCTDLRTIDQLWIKYSKGQFGFSVQKKIWQKCGQPREYNSLWEKFGAMVGWRSRNGFSSDQWIDYIELTFDTSAPMGHLPGRMTRASWMPRRSPSQYPLNIRRTVETVAWLVGGEDVLVTLFSRIEACKF